MDRRDCTRLAQALAKAWAQPHASAAAIEQCIYQIGLMLAREVRPFDLGAWQREIREYRVTLSAVAGAEACSDPSPRASACTRSGA